MFRLLKILFLVTPFLFGSVNKINKQMTSEDISMTYDIYPIPQNVEYLDKTLTLTKNISIVTKGDVDDATKEKAVDVLSLKPVLTSFLNQENDSLTNLILATYDSSYRSGSDLDFIPNHIDSYYLEINENNIIIVGKDSDAIYYGLSSLQFIFEQSSMEIRTLKIRDYSQSALRGFIEGYYGIPWTPEERKELMRFGSRVKTNIYVYAPKDDIYHSTSWRSLYTDIDYKILKEQVEVGRSSKTRLVWAIHPFMNSPLTRASLDSDLNIIKNKFEQVYSAGVRQFVVSADDVNMFSPTEPGVEDVPHHAILHKDLLNELSSWVKSKGDCYDLVFVPTCYNNTDEKCEVYYEYLMDGLDESIQIMWTGQKVCSSMNNMAYDAFYSYSGSTKKPFIWMNWPVNDYAINYLLMGEGEVFNKQYENDEDVEFSGLVVNPMQLAEASKLSIWACGDYAWNTKDFDSHTSYLKSFKYIEEDETEAFEKVCEHLTNTASKFENAAFKEAEDLKTLIDDFKISYEHGSYEYDESLVNEYLTNLIQYCEDFIKNASNRKLVKNIKPWVEAVKYTALSAKQYLKLVRNASSYDDDTLRVEYERAVELVILSHSQVAPNLIPGFYSTEDRPAYACTTVLSPFVEYLTSLIEDDICVRLGIDSGIKYSNLGDVYEGKLENMVDGDENTYCWFGSSSKVGSYVRIDLVTPTIIKDVSIIFGNTDPNSFDKMKGKVQISLDAKNWTDIGEFTSKRNVIDIRDNPLSGRFIRFYCTEEDSHWVSIREISVNTLNDQQPVIKYAGFAGIYEGNVLDMVDNSDETYCWFSSKPDVGGYIQFDYLTEMEINDISVIFGTGKEVGLNDKFTGVLQYSLDGKNWIDIGNMNSLNVLFDLRDNPITARYLRMYALEDVPGWVAVKELRLNTIPSSQYLYTYNTLVLENGDLNNLCDDDVSTYCHFSKGSTKDASITLDLREVKNIDNIVYKQGCPDYPTDIIYFYQVYISSDKENWTRVGEEQYRDTFELKLDLSSDNISARYIKIVSDGDLISWVAITEFDINK